MKRILLVFCAAVTLLGFTAVQTARAQGSMPESGDYLAGAQGDMPESDDHLLTPEELDELLSPIALYPDPLIAQILPAATFIDQIDEAERYVRQYGRSARIDDQPWDVSVKAIAHYPDILFMMDQKSDWTASLGQAFINQEQDVMDTIQRLRADAEEAGNLVSTPQQEVYEEDGLIRIVPADPELIYVPRYDPSVIYEEPSPSYGFITFGIGLAIGAWLDRDCDWRGHRVFYHGWQGGGWIGRARPHIRDRRHVYINNNNAVIKLDRKVVRHDTARFREDLRRNAARRVERPPSKAPRPAENRPVGKSKAREAAPHPLPSVARPPERPGSRVEAPRHAPVAVQPPERPDSGNFYRGRVVTGPQPAARSGYGGYGSGKDASIYRQRGRTSLENMGGFRRQQSQPQPTPRPAATPRPLKTQPAPKPTATPRPLKTQPAPRPAVSSPAPHRTPPPGRSGEEHKERR